MVLALLHPGWVIGLGKATRWLTSAPFDTRRVTNASGGNVASSPRALRDEKQDKFRRFTHCSWISRAKLVARVLDLELSKWALALPRIVVTAVHLESIFSKGATVCRV